MYKFGAGYGSGTVPEGLQRETEGLYSLTTTDKYSVTVQTATVVKSCYRQTFTDCEYNNLDRDFIIETHP